MKKIRIYNVNIIILEILFNISLFIMYLSIINNAKIVSNSRIHQEFTKSNGIQIQKDYDDIFGDVIVISPTDGDVLHVSDIFSIEWESSGDIKYVTISLYKNGNYFDTIALVTINDGEFEWEIGNYTEDSDYSIGVWDYNDFNVSDFSDYFVVTSGQGNRFNPAILMFITISLILGIISIGLAYYLIRKYR